MNNKNSLDFSTLVDHIKNNYSTKCKYEIIQSDVVMLIMLWYTDVNNNPVWMNICVRSQQANDYFEMSLVDINIDPINTFQSDHIHTVLEWVDTQLSMDIKPSEFNLFIK